MSNSKKERQAIFDKSGGVCWYCGTNLTGTKWHKDHFHPVVRDPRNPKEMDHPELDTFDNMVPSCAPCNRLKSSLSIENFRDIIYKFVNSLNEYSTQYRFAKAYGQIQETRHPIVFWFEKNKVGNSATRPIEETT